MSSNNLGLKMLALHCGAFEVEILPPPGCQMLHLGVLHEVVTHQCCKGPRIRVRL